MFRLPPGRNETDIWLPLTRVLPVSTRLPAALVTVMVLKAGLQLLGEPERHLARRRRDLVADARFGMVENGVRGGFTRREQQQQRDYSGKR